MYDDIKNAFQAIKDNILEFGKLNDSLFHIMSFDEWNLVFHDRSRRIRKIYESNEKNIEIIKTSMSLGINEEKCEVIYSILKKFKEEEIHDSGFTIPLMKELIDYYESVGDDTRLLFLYLNYGYEMMEYYLRMGDHSFDSIIHDCFYKVKEYRLKYDKLPIEHRNKIFIGYYNLISALSDLIPEYSCDIIPLYREMLDFYNSSLFQSLDGDNEDAMDEILYVVEAFLYGYSRYLWPESKARDEFFSLVKESLDTFDLLGEDVKRVMGIILGYYNNEYDKNELFHRLDLMNQEYLNMNLVYSGTEDSILEFCNWMDVTVSLREIIERLDISKKKKKNYIREITNPMLKYIDNVNYKDYTSYFDDVSSDLVKDLLPYLDSFDEKLDLIQKLIIKRQLITYIHSLMVKRISEEIAISILKNNKDLLNPLVDLGISGADMLDYIGIGAMIHDLGKCLTVGVINTQGRKLTLEEFYCIKLHPSRTLEFIGGDKDFEIYHDIMLGHHKWYDGTEGYPIDFDNTKSKYKIAIDIISISDSIDAATDIVGRNYTKGKSFDELLEELIKESGTRYNKDIVDIINQDEVLKEKLRYLTKEGREKVYYEAYREILDK